MFHISGSASEAQDKDMDNLLVLVIEDEIMIRMGAVLIVEAAGYAPLEASNTDVALTLLECRTDIRAVFTDVGLPGPMDGLELAHAIRGRWPPIHMIVTSGKALEGELPVDARFIRKPYSEAGVRNALE
jgi:CheY-like chemotaxis protein